MKIFILGLIITNILSCSSSKKCPDVDGFNPVIDQGCKVRIKNTFFADQLSPEIKEKLSQGQQVEFVWVPTEQKNQMIIPAHFEVKTVLGDGL